MSEPIVMEAMMAEVETTYLTDPTPVAGTDDLVLADRIWPVLRIEDNWPNLRDSVVVGGGGSLLPTTPTIPRGRLVRLNFSVEPRPKGSAYAAVGDLRGLGALYRACGLSVTLATSGLDFTWISASLEGCTIWAYSDGNRYRINGCRGKCRLVGNAGQPLLAVFEMTGVLRLAPDAAAVPSITYLPTPAPSIVSAGLTVGPWSPDFEMFELDFGQEVVVRPSGNASDGIGSIRIARHRPRFKLTADSVALATYDPYADALARTARTIACTIGTGAGLQIKLSGLTSYVQVPVNADLTGFTGRNLEYIVTAGSHRYD